MLKPPAPKTTRSEWGGEPDIVAPPMPSVESVPKTVLFAADGIPLKRPIGFVPRQA